MFLPNRTIRWSAWGIGMAALAWLAIGVPASAGAARIGFEEPFDNVEGWKLVYGGPRPKTIVNGNGTVTFVSAMGCLRVKPQAWPEWPKKPAKMSSGLKKEYGAVVDVDKYHYLVAKIDERGSACKLSFCGAWTQAFYTSGIRVFDLRNAGWLHGKQKIKIYLEIMNTSNRVTIDYIRLVSKLTAEEKKGLIPPPSDYYREKLSAHPYHKLEALNARAGRPRLKEGEGQFVVFEDTATRGETWKVTDQPGDQSFSGGDNRLGWLEGGRYFGVHYGRDGKNVWDYAKGAWRETRGGGARSTKPLPKYASAGSWKSRKHPGVVYGYRTHWGKEQLKMDFFRYDIAKGEEKKFGELTYRYAEGGRIHVRELSLGPGDTVLIGFRGTAHTWIVDPEAAEVEKRFRHIKLKTRLKGVHLSGDGKSVTWNTCYTFERLKMDLATGKVSLVSSVGWGGHAGGGYGVRLSGYEGSTLVFNSGLATSTPGDQIGIFAYYKKPPGFDYGQIVDKGGWWLVCGTGGDIARQHVMVNIKDYATILRLCWYHTSRNSWATNTYNMASPDATKVAWMSDQLGNGDVYYVVARRPDPPRKVRATAAGREVKVVWERPERSAETASYVVFGAGGDKRFRPLGAVPASKLEWIGAAPKAVTRFLVTAREWSGLESVPSAAVQTKKDGGAQAIHLDVWSGKRSRTARVVFDGRAFGTRCVRFYRATPLEKEAPTVTWENIPLSPGKHRVFLRRRPDRPGTQWTWREAPAAVNLAGRTVVLTVPPETLVDSVLVSDDPNYVPQTADDRFPAPDSARGAKAEVDASGVVRLAWTWPKDLSCARVDIYQGAQEAFPLDNSTIVGSVTSKQEPRFLDWGLRPGTTAYYKLVAVGSQGQRGQALTVSARIPAAGQLVYAEVGHEKARPGKGIKPVTYKGEAMYAPKPVAKTKKAEPSKFVQLAFPFSVPVKGTYSLWARYAPGAARRMDVAAALDEGPAGRWRLRTPDRLMSRMYTRKKSGAKVFTDRIQINGRDVWELKKGEHILRFKLDPAIAGGEVHAIGTVWATNDPSFRPRGYDPRADFAKRKK